jgi:hypothetical protein
MKTILFGLALVIAAPAIAQDAATPPAPQDSPAPKGGYSPPPMPPIPPGATVQFQPSVSPDVAFPPPAPLAKYPPCKKGQHDSCMERGSPK